MAFVIQTVISDKNEGEKRGRQFDSTSLKGSRMRRKTCRFMVEEGKDARNKREGVG